jgi:hypothetical protein
MANPYAAFIVDDDDDEDKVKVVKADDKPKRSTLLSIQLTKRRRTTRSSWCRPRKVRPPLQSKQQRLP